MDKKAGIALPVLRKVYNGFSENSFPVNLSSGIRQKGESQNGCFKKAKHAKISEKQTFLTPVCVSGGKKCLFFGNFGVLCFLETPVLRFAPLPYYRRYKQIIH